MSCARRQKKRASAPTPPQRSLKGTQRPIELVCHRFSFREDNSLARCPIPAGAVETVVSSHPNPAGTQPKKTRVWEKRRKGNRVYYANLVTRKTQWARLVGSF